MSGRHCLLFLFSFLEKVVAHNPTNTARRIKLAPVFPAVSRAAAALGVRADRDAGGGGDGHPALQRGADPGSGPAG